MAQQLHVAMLPSPGIGHLIPLVEFAKRLVTAHDFTITLVVPIDGPVPSKTQKSVLSALPEAIDHVFLPPVNFDDHPDGTKIETIINLTVTRSLPALRDVLKSMFSRFGSVRALVVDIFGTDAFDVAREFNMLSYIFFPTTATGLSLLLHLPVLDETESCEFRELSEPVRIPGSIPIPSTEFPEPLQDRKNDAYKWTLHKAKRYRLADGIVVNSFLELESGTIPSLTKSEPGKPPVYPVGPLVNMEPTTEADDSNCLTWLDKQPHGSVLFVSFGSGGSLSSEQINELAFGLEMSAQRFLWVVRRPNDNVSNATYFSGTAQNDSSFDFLPNGFLERIEGRGLVVPSWAPQSKILSHGSTGGFLSHCGWNSTLESVFNGVPLVAWPLFAEQRLNAFLLTQEIKVALRPKAGENGVVQREEIARVVKSLLEGEEGEKLRNRMKDLKEAAAKALSPNGASTKALSEETGF
ncbi:hydroquinone glucosyltransferase-like [Humulus lupulus]|uniref:hydroquinone glucosyltransferase-like n=1 Tax=Humulus lupulus TaxID=3486 RepID=UPI002B417422|nr:hydroquinone glucosyltransferase-like [Humulus lupulus]